ncbi:MAG: DUF2399 domain-containing protein [Propionibacterium sp.]|nr:DUF2399 domain-containing protein [Propionibacterium sp.]
MCWPGRGCQDRPAALFRDPHALERSTSLGRACARALELRRAVTEGGSYRDPLEAAADRHGAASRPLVCTFGLPSQATWELLTGLGDVRCHVRADGDVVGWRIVNQLRARLPGAFTWRMPEGCTAYEEELLEDLLSDLKGDTLGP